MNVKKTAIVGLLGFSILGTAFAAPPMGNDDHQPNGPRGEQQRGPQGGPQAGPHGDNHGGPQGGQAQPRYQQDRQAYRHGMPRPHNDWRSGQRVPAKYRGHGYYVNDWRSRDLPPPPAHHRWLRVNGDYVLVAVATGVISQILLGGY